MSKKTNELRPILIAVAPYVIIGGIALYLGKNLLKATKKVTEVFGSKFTGSEDKEELKKNVEAEQEKLIADGQKLSYTIQSYKSLSGMLLNAMGGLGTDEPVISAVFLKMKNDLDLTELYKQFGTQMYLVGVRPLYLDLGQWIYQELNTSEISELNKTLEQNNLTYRF
jgi:hypothetical protein|tara:strand:+ start:67 stop:570 length:504 start_codon:yes stop_codon:yes gene_type:complete